MTTAPATTTTPEDLLRRFRATREPEALGELYDLAAPQLLRVALSIAPDAASAENALQKTFLAVLEAPERWDETRPAITGAEGRYAHLGWVHDRAMPLTAAADGYRGEYRESDKGDVINFALRRGDRVVGRLVREDRSPVAGGSPVKSFAWIEGNSAHHLGPRGRGRWRPAHAERRHRQP